MDGCAENQYWKHKQVDVDDEITVFVAYCSLSELYDMSDMRVHRKIGNCQMAKPARNPSNTYDYRNNAAVSLIPK